MTDDIIEEIEEVEEIGQGEITFESTGIRARDMAIAGMINDAPLACKELIKNKVWDIVCKSVNPAGQADIELLKLKNIPYDSNFKSIIITLKKNLNYLNMSIPQAFQKNIIDDQLKRIKINSQVKPSITPIPNTIKLNGSILTHPDGSTYEFGKKGRRPQWVIEWLQTNKGPND